ncbi:hypothetical protein PsorP6_010581 [Peronosclerospora sorghi]|uniref:Uncharacterized protein n=1 Tax=Peronosclerospora sorghi TaxID=230839 RepID=A0ACC0VWD5_9STRA|nr:hypothetical protein PsorP6_010581 [Peronosclerospora sorghi]
MQTMKQSSEKVAVSQDPRTLVPLSLSLCVTARSIAMLSTGLKRFVACRVAKKEKILQMEVTKLENMISQRNERLCGLQKGHEYLLMTNSQLQERKRLHGETILSLMTSLGVHQEALVAKDGRMSDAIGLNELDATAEKCGVLNAILLGLAKKYSELEKQCMGLEEQLSRTAFALNIKVEQLNEAQTTRCLIREDICSTQWNIERDRDELAEIERRLHVARQSAQHEAAAVETQETALRLQKVAAEDLHTNWRNFQDMVYEEHRQLKNSNEVAISKQRELQKLLESSGATCSADVEDQQLVEELQLQLQRINEEETDAKFYNREMVLREKQEKQWLAFAQSSVKAKDDQLTWLNRHLEHLENERKQVENSRASDEAAYQAALKEHKAALIALDRQIKDASKHLKTTNRTISALDKKIAAVNKKMAPQQQKLAESKAKISAQQEKVAKLAATKDVIVAEALTLQNTLKQALLNVQNRQQIQATQEMRSEELRSSCVALESEIQDIQTTLVTLQNDFATVETAVKNRVDEVRHKFLSTFIVDDAKQLIQLLNKEITNSSKDLNKFDNAIASQAKMLKQRYDNILAGMRKKYDKISQQMFFCYRSIAAVKMDLKSQERQYNEKLKMLETQATEKREKGNTQRSETNTLRKKSNRVEKPASLSETSQDPKAKNETEYRKFDSPCPRKDDTFAKEVPETRKHFSKPTQRETKGAQKLASKPARRQLAPGFNPVDTSPHTDTELIDLPTANPETGVAVKKVAKPDHPTTSKQSRRSSASGARQPRLKRRTLAQKAGKLAKNTPGTACCAKQNHAPEGSTQDSIESPVGCDDDIEASQSALVELRTETTAVSTASPKLLPQSQKISAQNQIPVKRHRTGKAQHRSRRTKVKRVSRPSLVRAQVGSHTVDWSAVDSFSFD